MIVSKPSCPFQLNRLAFVVATALCSPAALAQQTVQQLDTVVVTAAGHEQEVRQAPASISVVTRKELEEKSFTDLADALRDVEGIDVRGATGNTGNLNISIRGMPSDDTLVLIDGRRENTAGD